MTGARRDTHEFVHWLVERNPTLAAVLEEHLADDDELLPHVFFGDVTRNAADLARRASTDAAAAETLTRLLCDLEHAMVLTDEDDPVDNLIWASFVENAQGVPGDAEEPLRNRLRPFPQLDHALSHYDGRR